MVRALPGSTTLLMAVFATAALDAPSDLEVEVQAILEDQCALCHDGSEGLDLSAAPSSLLGAVASNGAPMLVAGDPQASYLVRKIQGGPDIEGDPMPLEEPPLSAEAQQTIRMWVASLDPADSGEPPAPEAAGDAALMSITAHGRISQRLLRDGHRP